MLLSYEKVLSKHRISFIFVLSYKNVLPKFIKELIIYQIIFITCRLYEKMLMKLLFLKVIGEYFENKTTIRCKKFTLVIYNCFVLLFQTSPNIMIILFICLEVICIEQNKTNKKNLVWHSHNFLLPYITVEEYFFQQYFHI